MCAAAHGGRAAPHLPPPPHRAPPPFCSNEDGSVLLEFNKYMMARYTKHGAVVKGPVKWTEEPPTLTIGFGLGSLLPAKAVTVDKVRGQGGSLSCTGVECRASAAHGARGVGDTCPVRHGLHSMPPPHPPPPHTRSPLSVQWPAPSTQYPGHVELVVDGQRLWKASDLS
jgi:hypothetical protein